MDRQDVYKVLDSEREYQNRKWGGNVHDSQHSIGDWLTYMDYYLHQAKRTITKGNPIDALSELRKVTALGVAAMEKLGALERGEDE